MTVRHSFPKFVVRPHATSTPYPEVGVDVPIGL
jgi:hypothetical protein